MNFAKNRYLLIMIYCWIYIYILNSPLHPIFSNILPIIVAYRWYKVCQAFFLFMSSTTSEVKITKLNYIILLFCETIFFFILSAMDQKKLRRYNLTQFWRTYIHIENKIYFDKNDLYCSLVCHCCKVGKVGY